MKPNPLHPANTQAPLFALGILVFAAMAVLGWLKLPLGFNFTDDGLHMTDAWRLAMGDTLFPDSFPSVMRLCVLFNAAVFKLNPDITLLGFRQLQYGLTLLSTAALGWAVFRWSRSYWHLPWVLSLFAFTGLDVVGKGTNLSYHNYVHLFVTWHVTFLLLALGSRHRRYRPLFLIGAGLSLVGIGMGMLPMSLASVCPVVLWLVARRLDPGQEVFTLRDLTWVVAPVAIVWIGLVAAFHPDLLRAVGDMAGYYAEGGKSRWHIHFLAIGFCATTGLATGLAAMTLRLPRAGMIAACAALSAGLFAVMKTNLFGALDHYWRGWFDAPMWMSTLLIVFLVTATVWCLYRMWRPAGLDREQWLILILLLPGAVVVPLFGHFSEMGMLSPNFVAIPVLLGGATLVPRHLNTRHLTRSLQALLLVLLLFPFYYQTAQADWRFTYFDMVPERLNRTVAEGFAAGIRTNFLYDEMIRWVADRAQRYSTPEDRIIAFEGTPMVHMITGRLPALNHSWLGLARSVALRSDAIRLMESQGRAPRLAFFFVTPPLLLPVSLEDGTFMPDRSRNGLHPTDPVHRYVARHMQRVDVFQAKGKTWVELYVRRE
ncbi:MAG: hypothetical protein ACE5FN_03090 [Leptospirillia bacterium]